MDPFTVVNEAIAGPLGGDVRTVVLVGISICLAVVGLRYVLGLFGVQVSQPKDDDDDD